MKAGEISSIHQARERSLPYSEAPPTLTGDFPEEPIHPGDPPPSASEPRWSDFAPRKSKMGFWEEVYDILSGNFSARQRAARQDFSQATAHWINNRYLLESQEKYYENRLRGYEHDVVAHRSTRENLKLKLDAELERYERFKRAYNDAQATDLAELDRILRDGATGCKDGVERLAQQVLRSIWMPAALPEGAIAAFDDVEGILLLTLPVPNLEEFGMRLALKTKIRPATAKEVHSSQEFLVHALPLRLVHEIFATPELAAVRMVGINIRLAYTNRSNGKRMDEIIGSLAATREEFEGINVAEVDPKLCFRRLKGVASPSFQDLSAVRPILTFDQNDKRIVAGREVIENLHSETNLAAVDWEDFEHIVRELFGKIFSARSEAAEVHVTRASRDYGVDALIYDPDAIHGGKFVVQAKRYVNTVEVAAVRDLFGTVQNEGANRGYLVTTSSFGPESYAFAKGKPLTLIDGSNLLQLLKDHGYSFRIDLKEARRILNIR